MENPRIKFITSKGDMVAELYEEKAPNTVANIITLAEEGYYQDMGFHRILKNFMAQGGGYETEGIGPGGPGYQIHCECKEADARHNFPGTISMAHAGRNTGGSQFFLNFRYNESLDGNHTVFARIISGMDVLEKIERTELKINGREIPIEQAKPDRIVSAEVVRKRDHSYRFWKKGETEIDFVAEAKARAEAKAKAEAEAKAKAKAEAEAKAKAEAEAKAKAEAEAKAKAEAEEKAKAEAEMKKKAEAEEKAKAEAKEKAEAEKAKSDESETEEGGSSEADEDEDKS